VQNLAPWTPDKQRNRVSGDFQRHSHPLVGYVAQKELFRHFVTETATGTGFSIFVDYQTKLLELIFITYVDWKILLENLQHILPSKGNL